MRTHALTAAIVLAAVLAACGGDPPPESCLTIKYGFCATGTAAECDRATRAFERGQDGYCYSELFRMNIDRQSAAIQLSNDTRKQVSDLLGKLAQERGLEKQVLLLQAIGDAAARAITPNEVRSVDHWPAVKP